MASEAFNSWWSAFKTSGDICPLRLGHRRDEVKAVLGEPDAVGGTSHKQSAAAIWRYGEVEFHFGPSPNDTLSLIWLEDKAGTVRVSIPRLS